MNVPKAYRKRYAIIRKSSGKAFADQWLSEKLSRGGGPKRSGSSGRKNGPSVQPRAGGGPRVSECGAKFAALMANPFTSTHSACLPVAPTYPSEKMTCWVKTVTATGTAGIGFALFSPKDMIANDQSGTDFPLVTTLAAYTGVVASVVPVASQIVGNNSNSPYTDAQITSGGSGNQFRLVAAGLRITFAGTELNRGGYYVGLCNPDHVTLSGQNMPGMLAHDGVDYIRPSSSGSSELTYNFRGPDDYEFSGTASGHPHNIGFLIYSSTAVEYTVEAYSHFEVIGPDSRGKTTSYTDETVARAVVGAMDENSGTSSIASRIAAVERGVAEAVGIATAGVSLGRRLRQVYDAAFDTASSQARIMPPPSVFGEM
jgi:hypothetical protein